MIQLDGLSQTEGFGGDGLQLSEFGASSLPETAEAPAAVPALAE